MFTQPIETTYDDFLYDCYISNLRLTSEDWEWYGKEEHHVELPERDGGVLTPLNSQSLTTHQHWIAGVLQSEVLGKCCFACVPKGVLPQMLETLRIKWARTHNQDVLLATKNHGKMWITDGIEQKLIQRETPIPSGWRKGRIPHSEETRLKIGAAGKGRVFSEETLLKLKSRKNVWEGRKHSKESREKMAESAKRRDPSTRINTGLPGERNPNYGKSASQETRRKQSEAQQARFKGNGLSEVTKQKMKEAQRARRLKEKEEQ